MVKSKEALELLPEGKLLIDTINAHSFVTAQKDETFAEALLDADVLIPDGISVVKAALIFVGESAFSWEAAKGFLE